MVKKIMTEIDFPDLLEGIKKVVQEVVQSENKLMKVNKGKPEKVNYLSRREVCEKFGISYSSLYRRINDGTIECFKLGSRCAFSEQQITGSLIKLNSKL